MKQTQHSLKDVVEQLENSAIFQMSLGSKELFHSNFIAWLCDNKSFRAVAKLMFHDIVPNQEITKVFREKNNNDIQVHFESVVLIIENKVKSLATTDQLKKYRQEQIEKQEEQNKKNNQNRQKTVRFLLLSLTEPFIDETEKNHWRVWLYADLAEKLQSYILPKLDGYSRNLLEDYINCINNLSNLQTIFVLPTKFDDLRDQKLFIEKSDEQYLREIRIHDLIVKLRANQIANLISQDLSKKISNCKPKLKETGWLKSASVDEVFVEYNLTRSQGLFGAVYILNINNSKIALGIQVQGGQFRLVVESLGSAEDIAKILLQEQQWFDFAPCGESLVLFDEENPGWLPKERNKFGNFGESFKYRYKKLNPEVKVKEVIETIGEYILYVHNSKETLQSAS